MKELYNMKRIVELIDGKLVVSFLDTSKGEGYSEDYYCIFTSDQSILPKISYSVSMSRPGSRPKVYVYNESDLINAFFGHIDDTDTRNMKNILNVIAKNKDLQNVSSIRFLSNKCFANAIRDIYDTPTENQTAELTEDDLLSFITNIENTLLYTCYNNLATLYAIELLCIRSGRFLKPCKYCGNYFISDGKRTYCSDDCATKAAREHEAASHRTLPEEVKLWRKIQQRLNGRIIRQNNPRIKARLEKELEDIKDQKDKEKEQSLDKYIAWLKKVDKETRKEK